jgi:hypothetical protein
LTSFAAADGNYKLYAMVAKETLRTLNASRPSLVVVMMALVAPKSISSNHIL